MSEAARHLDRFERALEGGARLEAYESVREAWRAWRAPALASLVERAAERLAPELSFPTKLSALQSAWLEAARTRVPAQTRALLQSLDPLVQARKGSVLAACLDELMSTSLDPSITRPLVALAAADGGTVNFGPWGKVLTRVFRLLEGTGDPRAAPALEEIVAQIEAGSSSRTPSTDELLKKRLPKLIAALHVHGAPALPQELDARVSGLLQRLDQPLTEAIAERPDERVEDQLYEAVLRDPSDEGVRAVWADALQQRGDPRGELVALQAAGVSTPKVRKVIESLVKKHWRSWVGPLAPAIVPSTVRFDRGLLASCETDVRRKGAADAVFSHPGWGTVQHLTFRGYGSLTPVMTSLEQALGVPEAGLKSLVNATFPRLRVLSIEPNPSSSYDDGLLRGAPKGQGMKALAATRGLPALRSLHLDLLTQEFDGAFVPRGPEHYRCLLAAPFASQLEELAVRADWAPSYGPSNPAALQAWLDALATSCPRLERFELRASNRLALDLRRRRAQVILNDPSLVGRSGATDLPPWAIAVLDIATSLTDVTGFQLEEPAIVQTTGPG